MEKIILAMFIALVCAIGFSSCESNDVPFHSLAGTYVSGPDESSSSSLTYTLYPDAAFIAVEVDTETNEVVEEWSGQWLFDEDKMEITFIVYEDGIETYTAHVSNDYKSFSIFCDEDSEYEVYNKVK